MALTIVTDASGVQDLRTLSWNCGTLAVNDIIVISMITEDASLRPMNAPTATGVTFTQRVLDATASHDWVAIYTGVVSSGGAKTVTATINWVTTAAMHNGTAVVCPTADGYSLAGSPHTVDTTGTGAPSASITDTAGNLIIGCNGDWAAVDGASRAFRGTVTQDLYSFITGASTNYFWHQTASGPSDTIGLTAPTGQTFTTAAVEVLFSGGAAAGRSIVQAAAPFPPLAPPYIEPNSRPFQLLGDATTPAGDATPSLADTGAADDSSFVVTVTLPLTDSGAADDTSFAVSSIDPNQAGPQIAWMFLEPSAAAFQLSGDSNTNAATPITLLDAGAGADTLAVTAAVPLADTAAGSDTVTVTVAVPLTDTGAAADAATVAAAVPLTDAGAADDTSLSITAAVPLTDTGAAADAISVVIAGQADPYQATALPFPPFAAPFIEPTATPFQLLGDQSSSPQISLTDAGTAADTLAVTAAVPLSDTGSADDSSLTVAAALPLSDAGTGTDTATVTAAVPLTDTGIAADSLSVVSTGAADSAPPLVFFIPPVPGPFGHPTFVPFQLQGSSEIPIVTAVPPFTVTGSSSAAASVTGSSSPAATVTGSTAPTVTVR